MGLTDKISMLDKNFKGVEANPVGQNLPTAGNFHAQNGASNSPFASKDGEDHLVALLKDKTVTSINSGQTYDPTLMVGNQPGPPAGDQDFDGLNGLQFQRGTATADQIHQSSLSLVPGPIQNSPFQDRPDSNATSTPGKYMDNKPS